VFIQNTAQQLDIKVNYHTASLLYGTAFFDNHQGGGEKHNTAKLCHGCAIIKTRC